LYCFELPSLSRARRGERTEHARLMMSDLYRPP
jgi:hypothetical protein